MDDLQKVVTAVSPHGEVCALGVLGSTAYGLAHESSDVDRLGVFVATSDDVLGMHAATAIQRSVTGHDPDFAVHELGKFVALAAKANPTVLELLFCTHYDLLADIGTDLVSIRSSFLSTTAVRAAYGGYATQQAARLLRRADDGKEGFSSDTAKRTAKHGRHCRRLMLMGSQLLSTGELTLDVSEHRDVLFAAGELAATNPDAFHAEFTELLAELDTITSVLPDDPDMDRINKFLVAARRSRL